MAIEVAEQFVKVSCNQMRIGYMYRFILKNNNRIRKAHLMGFHVRTLENGIMDIIYDFEPVELEHPYSYTNNDIDENTLMEMI